jgi:hypothetical protein
VWFQNPVKLMADIKISCPHCKRHITCDELWGGHELQCPICQGTLTVPTRAAAPPPAPAHSSLVPRPPTGASPRLAIGQGGAQKPAVQDRGIPIRNLAPPKKKESNLVVRLAITAAVVVALGAGGYFGFIWLKGVQEKANEKSHADEARNSGESQVGHIANLNAVLDATEPGHYPGETRSRSVGPKARSTGVGEEISVGGDSGASPTSAAAAMEKALPVVPPVYTLELESAKIPEGRVNGVIAGTNFVAESSRIDPTPTAQVLRFTQGQPASPEREMLVYLHLKPGEKLGGQVVNVTSDMHGAGVPSVAKRWKTNPRYAPSSKFFSSGYAMKLELGALTNGVVPGKIYLALPDTEQSVIAGIFMATTTTPDPAMMQVAPTPAAVPTAGNAATAEAMRKRYGIGK